MLILKKMNKFLVLSLAVSIMISPIAVSAEETMVPINQPIKEVEDVKFIEYQGTIDTVNVSEDLLSILVESNVEGSEDSLVFHISKDVLILDSKTMDYVKVEDLKEDMEVAAFYRDNTPILMSMPGQLTPNVLVVHKEEGLNVHVATFSEELISNDNMLKIEIDEETIIVDEKNEEVNKEDIVGRDLIVFYDVSTKSIPAEARPKKIIVMDKVQADHTNFNMINILEKDIELNDPMYVDEEGTVMIPLREIAEALGYEIKWNQETMTAELTKDAQWTAVKIGEDNYNFAKMLVKLGTAPALKNDRTFVPVSFLNEVFRVETEVSEEGVLSIIK